MLVHGDIHLPSIHVALSLGSLRDVIWTSVACRDFTRNVVARFVLLVRLTLQLGAAVQDAGNATADRMPIR